MNTKLRILTGTQSDVRLLKEAADVISGGGLVAFPTETVYGLGADALNREASEKIYAAKGRPSDNPLIVHIADIEALFRIAKYVPEYALRLSEHFWPGPLTMIFEKTDMVPKETTGGLSTVAVRMPNHKAALEFIRAAGGYIAAPSANISGRPSPTTAQHVFEDMNGRIDLILDGGAVGIGVESTIIDLTADVPMILRPGFVNEEMLAKVLGIVIMDPAVSQKPKEGIRPKAPGMKYRHYAPKGLLSLVRGDTESVVSKINCLVREKESAGKKTAVIATDETKARYNCANVKSIGTREDEEGIARRLYAILREFDTMGAEFIYSEEFDTPQMGAAIMNRLLKAAGHNVIDTI